MIYIKLAYPNKFSTKKANQIFFIFAFLILWLTACTPSFPPIEAPYSTTINERILNEIFDSSGEWADYDEDGLLMDAIDGQFYIESAWAGQFVWSSNYQSYGNTVIELDIDWLLDDDKGMAGIMCRGQTNGSGYYVLVSRTGQFSIRRLGQNQETALRKWQRNSAIPDNGRSMRMRVICIDDYIGLYINGIYIDGAKDSYFREGIIGLVAGLPPSAGNTNRVAVAFDDLRVWDAELN